MLRLAACVASFALFGAAGAPYANAQSARPRAERPARPKPAATPKAALPPKRGKTSKLKRLNRDTVRATNDILETYIKAKDARYQGRPGSWTFKVDGVELMVITDERADRMRIISPVVEAKDLDQAVLIAMLQANFDRALDAKYSIYQDAVWAVYTHPLSPTTKEQFDSASRQVAQLVKTFGTTFSSLDIVFGAGQP